MTETIARKSDEGTAFWVLGGLYEVKAASEETDGAMTIMQMTIPAGAAPPPHTHPGTEVVYVIEGNLRYHIGDETIEGGPGSLFYIPQGTWEWFEPAEGETIRILVTYAPGGIEKFFAEIGEQAPSRTLPPPLTGPPDFGKIAAAGARHGMELRPPHA